MQNCFKDTDCPNIGYRCYADNIFKPGSQGSCHCWSSLTLHGNECQSSEFYAKFLCCFAFLVALAGVLFSAQFIKKVGFEIFKGNAFSTTLIQNTLGFISACAGHGFGVYRVFFPNASGFWKVTAYYYFICASLIHGVGSALNISLMWIEISAFKELKIVKNVERTKTVFVGGLVALYLSFLVLGVILYDYQLLMAVNSLYVIFLMTTFGIGARRMSHVLSHSHSTASTAGEARRKQATDKEVQRIFSNTQSVLVFTTIYLCSQIFYLLTFRRRIPFVSFPTFICFQIAFLCIEFTVLWHLRGKILLSWEFHESLKGKKRYNLPSYPSTRKIHITPVGVSTSSPSIPISLTA